MQLVEQCGTIGDDGAGTGIDSATLFSLWTDIHLQCLREARRKGSQQDRIR